MRDRLCGIAVLVSTGAIPVAAALAVLQCSEEACFAKTMGRFSSTYRDIRASAKEDATKKRQEK